MLRCLSLLILMAFCLPAWSVEAKKDEPVKEALKVGDALPDLITTDENGQALKLASFKDKSGVVLFFYPKAFTGG